MSDFISQYGALILSAVGDTLLMVLLLVGSAMMISLGIIGYYISKIYEEVKRRPRYIISKVIKNGNIQD